MSSIPAHFWAKVDKDDGTGCWLWTAGRSWDGYGKWNFARRRYRAHRWLYEQLVGPIPQGLQLDHLCRDRLCVRPDHLEVVTPGENTRRGAPARATHCKRGHPFTPENTYRRPAASDGRRRCRACNRSDAAAYRVRQKAAG